MLVPEEEDRMSRSRLLPLVVLMGALALPSTAAALEGSATLPVTAAAFGAPATLTATTSPLEGPAARSAATRRVVVADDRFLPRRFAVRRGTTIRWAWSRRNFNRHDVALRARPRGVARFRSPSARRSFVFRRKLRRPGAYRFVCNFHAGMAMRVSVRR
jgi:plastocyanin